MAVRFGPDWGGNSLTVGIGNSHSHVGFNGASFDNLVDSIYKLLVTRKDKQIMLDVNGQEATK